MKVGDNVVCDLPRGGRWQCTVESIDADSGRATVGFDYSIPTVDAGGVFRNVEKHLQFDIDSNLRPASDYHN